MHALLASAPASASVLGFESTEALLPALVRVLAAGLGAGFLARVLGRSPRGAAFAALATAAGALFLRADEHGALQGLAAFPWMLLGLELGRRAEERVARVLWVAVVAAAFVFGAHAPEEGTRVFLALAGLAWCARGVQSGAAERANGLDGFVAVLCGFLASCVLEGAPSMERAEANARAVERVIQGRADPLLLAIVVVAALVAHRWRALARTDEKTRGSMLLGAAGVVLAFGAWLWIADARGASGAWRGLFTGAGALALPVIGLALAVLFDPKAAAGAPRALLPLAAVAGLLALRVGALDTTWSRIPWLGVVEPACAAPIAVVAVAQCAALALERASRGGRALAAGALLALAGLAFALERSPARPDDLPRLDPDDELVASPRRPAEERASNAIAPEELVFWVHPGLQVDARLRIDRLGEFGAAAKVPLVRVDATRAAELTRGSTLPPRAQVFTLDAPLTLPNEEGWWTLRAELLRTTTGEVLGHRDLAHVHTPAPAFERWSVLFALALTLALLVLGRPGTRGDALLMLAIVGATGSAALSLEA